MTRYLLSLLLALPTALSAASPIAEVICAPTPAMYDRLSRQQGARQSASGIRDPEQIMEVWTGPGGDWTLVVTYASGTSCIVAIGQDWSERTPPDPA